MEGEEYNSTSLLSFNPTVCIQIENVRCQQERDPVYNVVSIVDATFVVMCDLQIAAAFLGPYTRN